MKLLTSPLALNCIHKTFFHLIEDNYANEQDAETKYTRKCQTAPIKSSNAEKGIAKTFHDGRKRVHTNDCMQFSAGVT